MRLLFIAFIALTAYASTHWLRREPELGGSLIHQHLTVQRMSRAHRTSGELQLPDLRLSPTQEADAMQVAMYEYLVYQDVDRNGRAEGLEILWVRTLESPELPTSLEGESVPLADESLEVRYRSSVTFVDGSHSASSGTLTGEILGG